MLRLLRSVASVCFALGYGAVTRHSFRECLGTWRLQQLPNRQSVLGFVRMGLRSGLAP